VAHIRQERASSPGWLPPPHVSAFKKFFLRLLSMQNLFSPALALFLDFNSLIRAS